MDLEATLNNYNFIGENSKGKEIYEKDGRYFRKENSDYIVERPYWARFGTLEGTK